MDGGSNETNRNYFSIARFMWIPFFFFFSLGRRGSFLSFVRKRESLRVGFEKLERRLKVCDSSRTSIGGEGEPTTLPRKMVMDNLVNEMRGNLILATFHF